MAEYTGDSFRDLTCIARLNEKMWSELFLWNKTALVQEIDRFDSRMQRLKQCLIADDREGLEQMFRESTERRAIFDKRTDLR